MGYLTKSTAVKAGRRAFEILEGYPYEEKQHSYELQVHKNLGLWYCSLQCGFMNISVYPKGKYGTEYMILIGHAGTGIYSLPAFHGTNLKDLVEQAKTTSFIRLEKEYGVVIKWLKSELYGDTQPGK